MQRDELESLLQRWGAAQIEQYQPAGGHQPPKIHILDKVRDFAPGTRIKADRALIGRDGTSRRKIMARAASVKSMRTVPLWACSPITCTETRAKGPPPTTGAIAGEMPESLRKIDKAVQHLFRHSRIQAIVVRAEYTEPGTQKLRAAAAERAYQGRLSYWQYRRVLEAGMNWLCAAAEAVSVDKLPK